MLFSVFCPQCPGMTFFFVTFESDEHGHEALPARECTVFMASLN